jgi:hypothetical protein
MARVHRVNRSNKEHICGRGGHVIPKGEPYLHASPGFRRRKPLIRCVEHPFRPSELTTSAASEPLAAVEAFEDAAAAGFDSFAVLVSAGDELKEAAESYLNDREYALEAWEHGNSQLEELRDQAQEAYDELDGHSIDEQDEPDEPGDEPEDTDSDEWAEWEEANSAHDEWRQALDDATDEALSVAGSVTF